jgi:predicted ester cyclase
LLERAQNGFGHKPRFSIIRTAQDSLVRYEYRPALLDTMANRSQESGAITAEETEMERMKVVALAGACTVLGALAGYNFALVREHGRLERNKTLVRRMHVEVWSEPNSEKAAKAARELYTSDFVLHDWTGAVQRLGADGVVNRVASFFTLFPDGKEELAFIVAEGDLVMDRFTTTGRQARDIEAIPRYSPRILNRGKTVRLTEMEMFRVRDGKLAEQWLLPDVWGANVQLGLFDPNRWPESICGAATTSGTDAR